MADNQSNPAKTARAACAARDAPKTGWVDTLQQLSSGVKSGVKKSLSRLNFRLNPFRAGAQRKLCDADPPAPSAPNPAATSHSIAQNLAASFDAAAKPVPPAQDPAKATSTQGQRMQKAKSAPAAPSALSSKRTVQISTCSSTSSQEQVQPSTDKHITHSQYSSLQGRQFAGAAAAAAAAAAASKQPQTGNQGDKTSELPPQNQTKRQHASIDYGEFLTSDEGMQRKLLSEQHRAEALLKLEAGFSGEQRSLPEQQVLKANWQKVGEGTSSKQRGRTASSSLACRAPAGSTTARAKPPATASISNVPAGCAPAERTLAVSTVSTAVNRPATAQQLQANGPAGPAAPASGDSSLLLWPADAGEPGSSLQAASQVDSSSTTVSTAPPAEVTPAVKQQDSMLAATTLASSNSSPCYSAGSHGSHNSSSSEDALDTPTSSSVDSATASPGSSSPPGPVSPGGDAEVSSTADAQTVTARASVVQPEAVPPADVSACAGDAPAACPKRRGGAPIPFPQVCPKEAQLSLQSTSKICVSSSRSGSAVNVPPEPGDAMAVQPASAAKPPGPRVLSGRAFMLALGLPLNGIAGQQGTMPASMGASGRAQPQFGQQQPIVFEQQRLPNWKQQPAQPQQGAQALRHKLAHKSKVLAAPGAKDNIATARSMKQVTNRGKVSTAAGCRQARGKIVNPEDLHGCNLKQADIKAAGYLEELVRQAASNSGGCHGCIITGKGKHSPGNIPKLKPAVMQLLHMMMSSLRGAFCITWNHPPCDQNPWVLNTGAVCVHVYSKEQ